MIKLKGGYIIEKNDDQSIILHNGTCEQLPYMDKSGKQKYKIDRQNVKYYTNVQQALECYIRICITNSIGDETENKELKDIVKEIKELKEYVKDLLSYEI